MVRDAIVLHLKCERPLLDRCPVDHGGNNAAGDTIRVLYQDFIVCRVESNYQLEARPGFRDTWI